MVGRIDLRKIRSIVGEILSIVGKFKSIIVLAKFIVAQRGVGSC